MVETTRQVSVWLENKPGRLAQVCLALYKEKINIAAVTVSESHERSVLRMVTDDVPRTRKVLTALNVPFDEQDVVQVEMRNQPGALAQVCEQLAAQHVNIDYAYCSAGGPNGKTVGIFRLSNPAKALKILATDQATRAKRKGHGARGWLQATKARPARNASMD